MNPSPPIPTWAALARPVPSQANKDLGWKLQGWEDIVGFFGSGKDDVLFFLVNFQGRKGRCRFLVKEVASPRLGEVDFLLQMVKWPSCRIERLTMIFGYIWTRKGPKEGGKREENEDRCRCSAVSNYQKNCCYFFLLRRNDSWITILNT